jgi:hypothetical protein
LIEVRSRMFSKKSGPSNSQVKKPRISPFAASLRSTSKRALLPHDSLAPSANDRVRSPSQIRGNLARRIEVPYGKGIVLIQCVDAGRAGFRTQECHQQGAELSPYGLGVSTRLDQHPSDARQFPWLTIKHPHRSPRPRFPGRKARNNGQCRTHSFVAALSPNAFV